MTTSATAPDTKILRAADGGRFGLTRIPAAGPVHAPVVYVPGMFTGRRFWLSDGGVGLAAYLAAAGFPGYIVERRAIGDTPAGDARHGLREHVVFDLRLVQRHVARSHARPAFWIGHSFGGVMAARAAAESLDAAGVAGLVLFATQFEVGKRLLDWPGNLLLRGITRLLGRFPARRAGLGPEDEPPAAIHDAAAWVARGRRGPSLRDKLAGLQCPVLAIAGAGDSVDPAAGCERFIGHFASGDKRFVLAGKAHGFAADYDHAGIVVSKPAQAEIWPLVEDWLRARTNP